MIQFKTWVFEQSAAEELGPFPVVVKIDGKELRVRKEKKGWVRVDS